MGGDLQGGQGGQAGPVAGDPNRAGAVQAMFARIAPGYDRANFWMSMGIDRIWRADAIRRCGDSVKGDVLDLCAGTLDFSRMLSPEAATLTALDFCQPMLDAGVKNLPPRPGRPPVRLICADAREIPLPDASLDAVLAGFGIRNVPEPERAVREVFRVLRPGGVFLTVDFFRPTAPLARLMSASYNRIVLPIVGGLITGDSAAYRYLADSMGAWTDRAGYERMCREAGFDQVDGAELFPPVAARVRARKAGGQPGGQPGSRGAR